MLLKPGTENQEYWFMFPGFDKVIHGITFFILGLFLRLTFPKSNPWIYFSTLIFYALLTEFLQHMMAMGRQAEAMDLVADALGISFAFLLLRIRRK